MNSPIRSKKRLYIFREPEIYVPILVVALVAWFAPVDVLDRLPVLQALTAFMRDAFPAMNNYVNKSSFPQRHL